MKKQIQKYTAPGIITQTVTGLGNYSKPNGLILSKVDVVTTQHTVDPLDMYVKYSDPDWSQAEFENLVLGGQHPFTKEPL